MRTLKGIEPKRDKNYLKWVRDELECSICGCPFPDPHHLIGHGQGGMATKASDYFIMPLCRKHHDELHRGVNTWEMNHGNQIYWIARTMLLAASHGIKTKAEFMKEIDNYIVNQLDRETFYEWLV